MEYGALVHTSVFESFSDTGTASEVDFMDELFVEGCWLETTGGYNFTQQPCATIPRPLTDPSHCLLSSESNTAHVSIDPNQQIYQEESEGNFPENITAFQSESFLVESTEVGKRWWIGPRANPGPSSSVKERLVLAVGYLKGKISSSVK